MRKNLTIKCCLSKGFTKQIQIQKAHPSSSPSLTSGSPKYAKSKTASQLSSAIAVENLQYLNNTPNSNQVDAISLHNAEKNSLLNMELQKSMLYYFLCNSRWEVICTVPTSETNTC